MRNKPRQKKEEDFASSKSLPIKTHPWVA